MPIQQLKQAFNMTRPSRMEVNAFNYAARIGDVARTAAFLDEHPGAIDAFADNGLTALMAAAASNMPTTVRMLLERGANPYEMTASARTARMFAEREGNQEIAWLLRKAETDFRRKALLTGHVPQKLINDYNYAARIGDDAAVLDFLSKFPYAVDAVADNGLTALMVAAANGRVSTVRLLRNHGASLTEVSPGGRTALGFAEREGQKAAANILRPKYVERGCKNRAAM